MTGSHVTQAPPPPPPPPPPPGPPGVAPATGWTPPSPDRGIFVGGHVPLRPMTVGDVLDGAVRLARAVWRPFLVLTLVVAGPFVLLGTPTPFGGGGRVALDPTVGAFAVGPTLAVTVVVALLQVLVVTPLQYAAAAWLMAEAELGRDHTWAEAARHGLRRVPRVLATALLVGLALGGVLFAGGLAVAGLVAVLGRAGGPGGLAVLVAIPFGIAALLLLLAGVAFAYTWGLGAIAAQTVEDLPVLRSLGRMWRLLRSRPVGMVFTGMVGGAVVVVVGWVLGTATALPLLAAGDAWVVRVLVGAVSLLASVVVTPFTMALGMLLYIDARIRSEGFDLQVRAAALADRP